MDSGYRLPKDRHDCGVGCISARELHVVGELIWWNALQNELASIGVLAFIAFERNSQKSNPDCDDEAEEDHSNNQPAKTQCSVVDVDLMRHEGCFSNEKWSLATERFPHHCII